MARKIIRHREYMGCTIWYNDQPGFSLRWSGTTCFRSVSADTLEGIKALIREDMTPKSKR